ncbi:MAG: hypothetical protein ACTSYJ_10485 [Candidatus Thorarchaeota archaeon]
MNYLGLGFLIFGAALNYTIGIDYATPFLIIALILNFKAIYNVRRDKNAIPSADQLRSHTIGISNNDPEIVNQIAKVAKARIMLFERPHPTNPLDTVRMIKCPKCRYLFELATSRIVGYTVYCPSCYKGTDLS